MPSNDADNTPAPAFVAFTICSRNFLAQAQLLHDGLRRHHPKVAFYVALCDEAEGADLDALPFEVLPMRDLGIPRLEEMTERYNITELNTALKPFAFLSLFDRHPGAAVAYFDPDIWVVSPLEELLALLSRGGADCVLTPHLTEPVEFAEADESRMLQFGIYNLGFCALRDTPSVRRIVAWWGRRLETQCVIDLPAGLFVDQKWADLLPSFIERTAILRHPGYNVAYWNLAQRTVRAPSPEDAADVWRVNGEPLRFFHFSGSAVDEDPCFSRHSQQFRGAALRDVATLFTRYCEEVHRFGRQDYRRIPYAFSWNGTGTVNEHSPSYLQDQALAGKGVAAARPLAIGVRPPFLPALRARSRDEMSASTAHIGPKLARRRAFEASLIPHGDAKQGFSVQGHCVVCGTKKPLHVDFTDAAGVLPDGRLMPNWGQHLTCPDCGLGSRQRAALHILSQEIRPGARDRIHITEQATPLHGWLRDRFPSLTSSEYLGPDSSLDLILGFDVLGRVPDARHVFTELGRCLRPGGTLLFTAPIHDHQVGAIRGQHTAPGYHDGWKLMEDLRACGFEDSEALFFWSSRFGYLGDMNSIFVCRKAADSRFGIPTRT